MTNDAPSAEQRPALRDLLTAFGQAYHKLISEGSLHGPTVDATEKAITDLFRGAPVASKQKLPAFIRRDVERAIEEALHPKGMSVHDGKARIGVDRLQYLMRMIDGTDDETSENPIVRAAFDLMCEAPLVAHGDPFSCIACPWLAKVQEWYSTSGLPPRDLAELGSPVKTSRDDVPSCNKHGTNWQDGCRGCSEAERLTEAPLKD